MVDAFCVEARARFAGQELECQNLRVFAAIAALREDVLTYKWSMTNLFRVRGEQLEDSIVNPGAPRRDIPTPLSDSDGLASKHAARRFCS